MNEEINKLVDNTITNENLNKKNYFEKKTKPNNFNFSDLEKKIYNIFWVMPMLYPIITS